MKFLLGLDSFKGCLSSRELGEIGRDYLEERGHQASLVFLSDGGEGLVDSLMDNLGAILVKDEFTGPLGCPIEASYGLTDDLVLIESAKIIGLDLVEKSRRNPLDTTSYGLGQAIKKGLDQGRRNFLLGLGGSSTNDLGLGMLRALGYRFYDDKGQEVGIYGRDLEKISLIDDKKIDKRLKEAKFTVACDVKNPLCGSLGASQVYAGQKGASQKEIEKMDGWFSKFASLIEENYEIFNRDYPGVGAAGGLGYGLKTFLGADLKPGFDLVAGLLDLEEKIGEADYVITGEGQLNDQSLMGKGPVELAKLAKKQGRPCLGFFGSLDLDLEKVNSLGLNACFTINQGPISLVEAMDKTRAEDNFRKSLGQVVNLLEL